MMLRAPARALRASGRRKLHTVAHTLISPTPEYLQNHLTQFPPSQTSKSLYLLSTSLASLPSLLSTLQSTFPSSIGSFQITPPNTPPTLSIATFTPTSPDEAIHIFRSELSGRLPAEVGKWQRRAPSLEDMKGSMEGEMEMVKAEGGWANLWKSDIGHYGLIPELDGVKAESLLLLTDSTPKPLLTSLDALYPSASKLGLLTAPTPFVTNRPHTLIRDREIFSSGTLGLAFSKSSSPISIEYGLEPLTNRFQIVSAQGNLLLKIDGPNSNPTQTLMGAIQKRTGKQTKDEEFYLAFLDGETMTRVVKIQSGDPSRGALSLEMEEPLRPGQTIQYMHRPGTLTPPSPLSGQIAFGAISKTDSEGSETESGSSTVDGFLGLSEDGVIVGSVGCNVPGVRVSIAY